MKVRPISITMPLPGVLPNAPAGLDAEALMVYCARVSSPHNQHKHATGSRLLRYCIDRGHWSVFDMVDLTMEIETSRAIAAQILRHYSFRFQEFSQRYSAATSLGDDFLEMPEMRAKHVEGNRQGSGEDMGQSMIPGTAYTVDECARGVLRHAVAKYGELLDAGVAPECARMVLPLCTRTRLYMKGSVRSWIHYLQVRTDAHAQKEHREPAKAVRAEFIKLFPVVSKAMEGWIPPNQPAENQPAAEVSQ
jgi:thymidylate synthase (FAD)